MRSPKCRRLPPRQASGQMHTTTIRSASIQTCRLAIQTSSQGRPEPAQGGELKPTMTVHQLRARRHNLSSRPIAQQLFRYCLRYASPRKHVAISSKRARHQQPQARRHNLSSRPMAQQPSRCHGAWAPMGELGYCTPWDKASGRGKPAKTVS